MRFRSRFTAPGPSHARRGRWSLLKRNRKTKHAFAEFSLPGGQAGTFHRHDRRLQEVVLHSLVTRSRHGLPPYKGATRPLPLPDPRSFALPTGADTRYFLR
jgi:hypothetical protein